MSVLLELHDVEKTYDAVGSSEGPRVLRGVSLRVAAGESLAIVGPSGCGKSTLLNMIGGLDQPGAGRVLLEGRDLAALSADALARVRNEKIGFMFQSHHLLPQCTALENVLVPTLARRRGADGDSVKRGRELLEQVALGGRLDHRPAQLSGGECQRVAVVRGLINRPALLLADEPTGSLDERAAGELADLLAELHRREGVALITVTHAPRLAARMSRTLRLHEGRLVEDERQSHPGASILADPGAPRDPLLKTQDSRLKTDP